MGMDPLFASYLKLRVRDVLNLAPGPLEGLLMIPISKRVVSRVEIMGVVVAKQRRRKPFGESSSGPALEDVLLVDDGSGLLECVSPVGDESSAASAAAARAEVGAVVAIKAQLNALRNGAPHGSSRDSNWAAIHSLRELGASDDPNRETLHWLQVVHLSREVYRVPAPSFSSASPSIEEAMTAMATTEIPLATTLTPAAAAAAAAATTTERPESRMGAADERSNAPRGYGCPGDCGADVRARCGVLPVCPLSAFRCPRRRLPVSRVGA